MNEPYELVTDVWEGNPDYDPDTLQANRIRAVIVRLNNMNGGHHVDAHFVSNWAKARTFPAQAIYFVYNPWVNGRANYEWLAAHLPRDYGGRRLLIDLEVRYPGYSAADYAREFAAFLELTAAAHPIAIYSGGGFLDLLSAWPKNVDYWWAGYAYGDENRGGVDLRRARTWDEYRARLARLDYAGFTRLCPGRAAMWQCSGDGVHLPGFGNYAVDISVFPGTLEELVAWFGCEEEQSMTNAIGLYTESENWTNPNFDFIAGYAGKSWLDTPANLKAIDQHAQAEGKPFLTWYKFNVDFYSRSQFMAKDEFWPPIANDEPLQKLILVMQNRNIAGVIIEVMDEKNHDGKVEQPQYIAYAAKVFCGRVADWLKVNKPNVKLIVASSNAFIASKAPDMNNWIGQYPSLAVQTAAKPLVASLPDPTDKPAYLDNRPTCEFWRYYENYQAMTALMVYRMGDRAALWQWLGFTAGTTPPPPPPPAGDDDVKSRLAALEARVAALEKFMSNVKGA